MSQAYQKFHLDKYGVGPSKKRKSEEAEIEVDTEVIWDLGEDTEIVGV